MFICQNEYCKNPVVPPCQPVNKIVTKYRKKLYEIPIMKHGKVIDTEMIEGREIAKEIDVCPSCYQTLTGKEPKLAHPTASLDYEPVERPVWRKQSQEPKKKPVVEVINPIQVIK